MARATVEVHCNLVSNAIGTERSGETLAPKIRLVSAAGALLKVVRPPAVHVNVVHELLETLLCVCEDANDVALRAKALGAVAQGIIGCGPLLGNTMGERIADVVCLVVCPPVASQLACQELGKGALEEEALVLLQALCEASVESVCERWPNLVPVLVECSESSRDILALHAVRVAHRLLSALMSKAESGYAQVSMVTVYESLVRCAFLHTFHSVRAEAALCCECLLRAGEQSSPPQRFLSPLRALLRTANHDDSTAVRAVAVRALGYTPVACEDITSADEVVSSLLRLFQTTASVLLQSRAVWALAAVLQRAIENRATSLLIRHQEQCIGLVSHELVLLVERASQTRRADEDTRATGLIRLASALLNHQYVSTCLEQAFIIDGLCDVIRAPLAAKTRWNACAALSSVFVSTLSLSKQIRVRETLLHACEDQHAPVKVRSAAAKALLPAAAILGIFKSVKLYQASLLITDCLHSRRRLS